MYGEFDLLSYIFLHQNNLHMTSEPICSLSINPLNLSECWCQRLQWKSLLLTKLSAVKIRGLIEEQETRIVGQILQLRPLKCPTGVQSAGFITSRESFNEWIDPVSQSNGALEASNDHWDEVRLRKVWQSFSIYNFSFLRDCRCFVVPFHNLLSNCYFTLC